MASGKKPTVKYTTVTIYGTVVHAKVTTINNLNPPRHTAEVPCPITKCKKVALRDSDRTPGAALSGAKSDMDTHFKAIHMKGSHAPNQKRK